MKDKGFWITLFALACLGIYLFVSAPPPLPLEQAHDNASIPVTRMFTLLETENDEVRALWTQEIVGQGKKVGLKFDEHWRDQGLDAGPLPALFLRETAKSLEKDPVQLSLFLGSDFPISDANRFEGIQQERFQMLRQFKQPQFFFMADTGLHSGMFPDFAIKEACIDCHNHHEQSPKQDWKLNDVMGATTWMYPSARVSVSELIQVNTALTRGFQDAYGAYLKKVQGFAKPPVIGESWPRDGFFLPSLEVFMHEVLRRTAPHAQQALSALVAPRQATGKDNGHVAIE